MRTIPPGPVWFRPKGSPNSSGEFTRKDLWYFHDGMRVRYVHIDHEVDWHVSREYSTLDAVGRDPFCVLVYAVGDRALQDPDLLVDINL